ncbi:MAG: exopolysaccharide biosynthesis polyprenyl glycosylphosphotransferase [Victivallaceae bacterium]|nr:exopolysaccharide biosynthesis polyprenyl glycosylphosphotransferase [Victivallaceae bacterium]MDD4317191.1 exopolysaccharide biosynthesis polyprenyl glycosylphosphotransferase [Victivallaceae bacterium]MDD5663282.1 exopolysaccharide biosynthesis polyprenyl glycosylphosphotransferase [Victivallaceae bacterium]
MDLKNKQPYLMRSKYDLEKELVEFLLTNGKNRKGSSIKWKLFLWRYTMASAYVLKRVLDFCFSFLLILLFSPLIILVAIWIKLDSPGPLIYRQVRVGLNGRHFNFYKFRSMYCDADRRLIELSVKNESADGVIFKMKKDPRVTRIGRFIRKFSIDELPQLFNVLLGDMSLVGPRPPLPKEVEQYTLDDRKRLNVVPGITGLWQVSGRSDIPFKKQVALDKKYIQSQSLLNDIMILLRTIPAVLTGRGAY